MSAPTDRPTAWRIDRSSAARNTEPATTEGGDSRALAVLSIAVVAMAVLPNLVQYLNVQHRPNSDLLPRLPLARDVSWATAVVLFLVCAVIALRRGHPDRNLAGLIILLLALLGPYVISPTLPGTEDVLRVCLAAAVILAVWNIGAPVEGLKWVSITGSVIGLYSIIGALIVPDHMNYETSARKALIADWQLAGPFGHSNALGNYCVLALALTPLIANLRWRLLHGLILCTAIMASASRTALIAAGVLALWWIICRFRSVISVRLAGTALIACCAATVLVLPLLSWNRHAFTGRGHIWAASLSAWEESRLVGLGFDWFTTTARSMPIFANWATLSSGNYIWLPSQGHNLFVDTLVRSGLMGVGVLALVLFVALLSVRALDVSSHQIAYFGYLIAFLVASSTEAIWVLLPTMELFPVVGFVFAVLIVARRGVHAESE